LIRRLRRHLLPQGEKVSKRMSLKSLPFWEMCERRSRTGKGRQTGDSDSLGRGLGGDLDGQGFHGRRAARGEGLVALGGDALQGAKVGAGARRDEPADDDVLLQALQGVA